MKILLICDDAIGTKMAGVGIRYFEIARQVARAGFKVTLAAKKVENKILPRQIQGKSFRHPQELKQLITAADLIFAPTLSGSLINFALRRQKILWFDLYDPVILEMKEACQHLPLKTQKRILSNLQLRQKLLLLAGDFFWAANPRQKQLWLQELKKLGRSNPASLVGLLPFGFTPTRSAEKVSWSELFPEIDQTAKIVLWGGGIWNWLDPLTPIQAIAKLPGRVHLVFLGTKSPTPGNPQTAMLRKAQKLVKNLNLEKRVHFTAGWIPYQEKDAFFAQADIGIVAHPRTRETKYANRTRVLEYLKNDLPIISTRGDYFAELIQKHSLGLVVNYGDVDGWQRAISKLLKDQKFYRRCQKNIQKIKPQFSWAVTTQELIKKLKSDKLKPAPKPYLKIQLLLAEALFKKLINF